MTLQGDTGKPHEKLQLVTNVLDFVAVARQASETNRPDERESEARTERIRRRDNLYNSGVLPYLRAGDEQSILSSARPKSTAALRELGAWWALPVLDAAYALTVLSGQPGQGKTYAAARMLTAEGGRYLVARDLPTLIRDGDSRLRAKLLVVDQVCDHGTDWQHASLFDIVDARQGLGRRTVLVTNKSRGDFEALTNNGALKSRMEACRWVTCVGDDLRR